MARVNEAFDNHDEQRLRELLNQWESSPESVKGEGIAVDLVRVIRKIALVEQRLKIVNDEILSLERCDLYELKSRAEEAEVEGRDLFQEMAFAIQIDIDEGRDRLEKILRTRLAI
jgi:hypothetical protein